MDSTPGRPCRWGCKVEKPASVQREALRRLVAVASQNRREVAAGGNLRRLAGDCGSGGGCVGGSQRRAAGAGNGEGGSLGREAREAKQGKRKHGKRGKE